MAARTYLAIVASAVIAVAALNLALGWYAQPLVGDLTRVGALSEREFGWNLPQVPVRAASNQTAVSEADVVVLGDSFSRLGLWQGELERLSGLHTHTELLGSGGCIDPAWFDRQAFKRGSTVIFESVERNVVLRLTGLGHCHVEPMKGSHFSVEDVSLAERPAFGISADLVFKLRVLLHDIGTRGKSQADLDLLKLERLLRADLFSNRRSDTLAYLAADDYKASWRDAELTEAIDALRALQARLAQRGVRFLFLMVPDKSSIYLDRSHAGSAARGLEQRLVAAGVTPQDLRSLLAAASLNQRDLYLPNDSHFGNGGYRALAAIVAGWLSGSASSP